MLKIKNIALILTSLFLVSCNNKIDESDKQTSEPVSYETSIITSEFEDADKQAPVYTGDDVVVSKVMHNSYGSYLQVEDKPFAYIGTQIRIDAFMNCDKLSYDQVELLFAEAAKLGVTCVQIPLEWAKIELQEGLFNFEYIYKMLSFANKYDLKVEFLWFGTNMCGDSHSYTIPDYILKDGKTYPKFDALRTGEYWNYYGIMWFLDFDNPNLIAKESLAISKCMEYVYEFDSTHGAKKPLIGMQVLNEPDIFVRWRIYQQDVLSRTTNQLFSESEGYQKICYSLDALGKEVKKAKYKIYTRVNLASSTNPDFNGIGNGIYQGNELKEAPSFAKAFQSLEGIDIVGDDAYSSNIKNIKGIVSMFSTKIENNFGHLAENDASYGNSPSLILASFYAHGGYSMYDLLTSPFFVDNNSANIDQGIILYDGDNFDRFTYKSHYSATQNIINGIKLVSHEIYNIDNQNFACFNLKKDYPDKEMSQDINTTNLQISFSTSKGAIGYGLDFGDHLDVYVTEDSTITLSGTVTKIEQGIYQNGSFVSDKQIDNNNSINLEGSKLYRIEYQSSATYSSTTWHSLGG